MHRSPGFKGHAPALQAGERARAEEGRAKKKDKEKEETAQRQTSSCSGQARLTGRGGMFVYFSAGEVTRRRASLVPNSGAGPQYRATSERHTHTGVDKAGVC